MKNPYKFLLLALFVIAIDQWTKYWVQKNMFLGEDIVLIPNWLSLHYVLNAGMAFGMELDHTYGKLALSLFRLGAMFLIIWYLFRLAKRNTPDGLLWSIAAILGGAIGNLIDSIFYGIIYSNHPFESPFRWFHGQVIDMVLVNIYEGKLPDWLPIWGGSYFSNSVFNIADAAIFLGVVTILIFQKRFFQEEEKVEESLPSPE